MNRHTTTTLDPKFLHGVDSVLGAKPLTERRARGQDRTSGSGLKRKVLLAGDAELAAPARRVVAPETNRAMINGRTLHLDHFIASSECRERALEAWLRRDVGGVFQFMDNTKQLAFVQRHAKELKGAGLYEAALIDAMVMSRTNNWHVPLGEVRRLLRDADPERLRAAGDPMPDGDWFDLSRGVAGRGRERRVRGTSWSGSFERAKWFALRFEHLADPAVFKARVPRHAVLAYVSSRGEDEYIVDLPNDVVAVRVWRARTAPRE